MRDDSESRPDARTTPGTTESLLSSTELLRRARTGDDAALGALMERHATVLRRWARGRLPGFARTLIDTDDLVQEAIMQTIRHIDSFEPRHEGALQAYLRQSVLHRIRDELRTVKRRPPTMELPKSVASPEGSPLEHAVGREAASRYEKALSRMRPEDREAIILRVEMRYKYDQIAKALNKPSTNAARMVVGRALVRLARDMRRGD